MTNVLLTLLLVFSFSDISDKFEKHIKKRYDETGLENKMSYRLYRLSFIGYYNLKKHNMIRSNKMAVVDFRQSSKEKRFYIIDFENNILLFRSYVAHGENSGNKIPISFSNEENSLKSSIGFYVTKEVYIGSNGLSLRVDGMDDGYNDKVRERMVVIHGADYVSERLVGTSKGCIAVSHQDRDEVIRLLSFKSGVFIYARNEEYLGKTRYLNIETARSQFISERSGKVLYKILYEE